jgi:NhaA family Na+:H+ antiporter
MKVTQNGRSFSPLRETENQLYPWVALGIVPVFAFFNSGIALSASTVNALVSPISLGIVLGLLVGKQLGIFGAVWLTVQLGVAKRPDGTNWWHVYGVALVAGIGFTMSLFVAGLAFSDPTMFRSARLSVVVGSLLSAAAGVAILRFASRTRREAA